MGGFLSTLFTGSNPTLKNDVSNLGTLAGFSTNVGQQGTNAALNFDTGLLSGDASRIAQVEAPEVQQAKAQAQQNKNTVAQFGNRGGGMNSAMAGLDDATRAKLTALTGSLQQGAAQQAGQIGTQNLGMAASDTAQQASLSQQELQNQLNSILGKGITGAVNYGESFLPIPHGG
jgi:hypothetical protein